MKIKSAWTASNCVLSIQMFLFSYWLPWLVFIFHFYFICWPLDSVYFVVICTSINANAGFGLGLWTNLMSVCQADLWQLPRNFKHQTRFCLHFVELLYIVCFHHFENWLAHRIVGINRWRRKKTFQIQFSFTSHLFQTFSLTQLKNHLKVFIFRRLFSVFIDIT